MSKVAWGGRCGRDSSLHVARDRQQFFMGPGAPNVRSGVPGRTFHGRGTAHSVTSRWVLPPAGACSEPKCPAIASLLSILTDSLIGA